MHDSDCGVLFFIRNYSIAVINILLKTPLVMITLRYRYSVVYLIY